MRKFPKADFECNSHDLMLSMFSDSASDLAMLCGVGIDTVLNWRDGVESVPYMAYQLIRFKHLGEVPQFCGPWSGWRFVENRLYPPNSAAKGAITTAECLFINDYRIDRSLTTSQSDLIDGLLRQRDFYKKQCGLEARMGMMLHNLYTGDFP
jgi:hypothetical protein